MPYLFLCVSRQVMQGRVHDYLCFKPQNKPLLRRNVQSFLKVGRKKKAQQTELQCRVGKRAGNRLEVGDDERDTVWTVRVQYNRKCQY